MKKVDYSDVDIPRLCTAIHRARLVDKFARQERTTAIRQYVGNHWSEEGTREKKPVNLLAQYVKIINRYLVAKSPRVMLSTFNSGQKAAVSAMESWVNKEIEGTHIAKTLKRIALDAMFSIGIAKVAIADPSDAVRTNWMTDAGTPFLERVSRDDWVWDPHCRELEGGTFEGHRYRAPLDVIKDSKIYSSARKKLEPSSDRMYNQEGDERANMLGRTYYAGDESEFEDHVDLWEIYLPRHKLIITLADDMMNGAMASGYGFEPLRVQRWLGPDSGPYYHLCLGTVPDNAMPKAPIQDLMDLDDSTNRAYRKLIWMVENFKELLLVRGGKMEDGQRIQEANHGQIVRCDDPSSAVTAKFNIPDQNLFAMAMQLKSIFNDMSGNIELLSGGGPQSKTATQDTMLNNNANAGVIDMQQEMVDFTSKVFKGICWYWWNDPFRVMRVKYSPPGLPDLSITREVYPGGHPDPTKNRRQGRFEDLEVEVDPYSMQHSTPQSRMAALDQTVMQVIVPMAGILQQQGIRFDINAYLQKKAKYMDMPDLPELVTIQEMPMQDSMMSGERPGMPQSTERKYVRESVSGRSSQGEQKNLMSSLLGVDTGGKQNGAMQ